MRIIRAYMYSYNRDTSSYGPQGKFARSLEGMWRFLFELEHGPTGMTGAFEFRQGG
jgi:hypothetical protein